MTNTLCLLALTIAQPSPLEMEIKTIAGETFVAQIQSLNEGSITRRDANDIADKQWYSLRQRKIPLPDWPRAPHLECVNGDRIVGTVTSADGDQLKWQVGISDRHQEITVPLSALRAAWLVRSAEQPPKWLAENRSRDVFQSRNGDITVGSLTALDRERNSLHYQFDGKDHFLDLAKAAAIGFNTDLARARRPKGPFYRVVLSDGSRISATSVGFDGKLWALQTLFRDSISVTAHKLVSIDVEQGPVVYLSSLKPAKYTYHTYDGEQYAWTADRCVSGDAIRLKTASGESTFDRGLGLHAECTLTYNLAGKYRLFEAIAGLDARSGVKGDVVLTLAIDGKEQAITGGERLTSPLRVIDLRVDVAGAKELTITVRRANGSHVQDHLNLAEVRLIPAN